MTSPAFIFGTSSFSELLYEHLTQEPDLHLNGFFLDADYITGPDFQGLRVLDFARANELVDPTQSLLFVPLGHTRINGLRRQKCEQALAMGFQLGSWVSSKAITPRAFEPQPNVLVFEGAIVQPGVVCGWNVIIRSGANIGHHSMIGDHVFVASGAVTGGNVTIEEHCWVGLGAVIRDGVRLAPRSFIGAGAVVVRDTEPDGVYVGVPARRVPGKTSMDVTS